VWYCGHAGYNCKNPAVDCAYTTKLGDGWCDAEANTAGCDWDGGGKCCYSFTLILSLPTIVKYRYSYTISITINDSNSAAIGNTNSSNSTCSLLSALLKGCYCCCYCYCYCCGWSLQSVLLLPCVWCTYCVCCNCRQYKLTLRSTALYSVTCVVNLIDADHIVCYVAIACCKYSLVTPFSTHCQ
jgi:hypothetical protein